MAVLFVRPLYPNRLYGVLRVPSLFNPGWGGEKHRGLGAQRHGASAQDAVGRPGRFHIGGGAQSEVK